MSSSTIHGDVASAIGQQVEQMILQAKKDSEARVRHDLSMTRNQLQQMEGLIGDLSERVARCARANGSGAADHSQTVDRAFLTQKIAQLEQKWGSEVKALKQDLHRTILAHNHNSDLMRHHRDALDEARRKLDAQTQPKAEQVDAQIEKVDRMLRAGQSKQRALDALTERLTALEQQVAEVLPNSAMPAPFPPMMPGMAGVSPMLSQPNMGQPPAVPKRGGSKKESEPPTEEEVRQRLMQAARANSSSDSTGIQFNAEAPVFVPRGATSTTTEVKPDTTIGGASDTGTGVDTATSVAAADQADSNEEKSVEATVDS
eukprot:CAMPEP_0117514280 /NCGR_PEP_ID=MMETSP0784-20121206/29987_1 /TAXON_ID=39447 /ORGANISM="" /LENGTH=315 /DNA_ID=CAMNT_0005310069 /DNA_START=16 /DNA_END=963 /DNA_ORIENTATION=+